MAIFFCPAFVMIPLGPKISGTEVGQVIAVLGKSILVSAGNEPYIRLVLGFGAMFTFTALLVRGIQLVLKTPKKTMTQRAEEIGQEDEEFPLSSKRSSTEIHDGLGSVPLLSSPVSTVNLQAPHPAQDPATISAVRAHTAPSSTHGSVVRHMHQTHTLTRAQIWAAFINQNLDTCIYATLFCIGVPVFFATGYSLPAVLPLNVLAYFVALRLPPQWRRFLHPTIISSIITITGIWILATIHGDTFNQALQAYQTKTRYIHLLSGQKGLPKPGTGDIFSSILDVSIVALALPMFQYRHELKKQVNPTPCHLNPTVFAKLIIQVPAHHPSQRRHLDRLPPRLPTSLPRPRHLTSSQPVVCKPESDARACTASNTESRR